MTIYEAQNAKRLHKAEVNLRTAAVAFATLGPAKDARDTDGVKANRRLLRAAVRYSEAKLQY